MADAPTTPAASTAPNPYLRDATTGRIYTNPDVINQQYQQTFGKPYAQYMADQYGVDVNRYRAPGFDPSAGEKLPDQQVIPVTAYDLNDMFTVNPVGGGGLAGSAFNYNGPITPGPFHFDAFTSAPWEAPDPFSYDKFTAPTMADLQNDPGYQFRLQQGEDAVQRSAAAKGTLLTGGTLQDLTNYAQQLASEEYDKIYQRAFQEHQEGFNEAYQTYNTNYQDALQNYLTNYNRLFGEHQENFNEALQGYDRESQRLLTNYNAALQQYQMNQSREEQAANRAAAGQANQQGFLEYIAGL